MTFSADIRTLRDEGDQDDFILSTMLELRPELSDQVAQVRDEFPDITDTEIVDLLGEIELEPTGGGSILQGLGQTARDLIGDVGGALSGLSSDIGIGALEGLTRPFALFENLPEIAQNAFQGLEGYAPQLAGSAIGLGPAAAAVTGFLPSLGRSGVQSIRDLFNQGIPQGTQIGQQAEAQALTNPQLSDLDFVRQASAFGDDDLMAGLFTQPEDAERTDVFAQLLQGLPESQTPGGRLVRETTAGAVGGAPFGFAGAGLGALGAFAGQGARELGLPESAALGADIGATILGGGLQNLASRGPQQLARRADVTIPRIAEETSGLSLKAELAAGRKAVEQKVGKLSDDLLQKYENLSEKIAKDKFTDLSKSQIANVDAAASELAQKSAFNKVFPVEESRVDTMSRLQEQANDIYNNTVKPRENELYTSARRQFVGTKENSEALERQFKKTIKEVEGPPGSSPSDEKKALIRKLREQLDNIEAVSGTRARRELEQRIRQIEANLAKTQESQLSPLGVREPVNQGEIIALKSQLAESRRQLDKLIKAGSTIPVNTAIENIQNLNNFIDFDPIVRTQKNRAIPVIQAYDDLIGAASSKNPGAFKTYEQAKKFYGDNVAIWGSDAMKTLRATEIPEAQVSRFTSPSNLRRFKTAFKGQNDSINALERQILEEVAQGDADSINSYLRQNSSELSTQAKNALSDLSDIKNPEKFAGNLLKTKKGIVEDVVSSITTGRRPDKTLKYMETIKGYEIVKNSVSPKTFDALKKQFFDDVIESIIKSDGSIDFNKAAKILENSELEKVLRNIGGQGLVQELKDLERFSKNIIANFQKLSPEGVNEFRNFTRNIRHKVIWGGMMSIFGIPSGLIAGLGLAAVAGKGTKEISKKLLYSILRNPEVFDSMRPLLTSSLKNPIPVINRSTQSILNNMDTEDIDSLISAGE